MVSATQVIQDYIHSFHEGLGRGTVFPRLQHRHGLGDLITTLLTQHDRGRHLTVEIRSAASGDLSTPAVRSRLSTAIDRFVTMYEPHEGAEDTVASRPTRWDASTLRSDSEIRRTARRCRR